MKRGVLLHGLGFPLIALCTTPVFAGFTGITTESKTFCEKPPDVTLVCNVYAQFDGQPDDFVSAVGGIPTSPLLIEVVGGGTFYQHPFGTDLPPLSVRVLIFPPLECDTFVTIGNKVNERGTDATGLTPDWPGFGPDSLSCDDCAWSITPDDPQGEPDARNRVLLGQFTVRNGTGVSGTVLVAGFSNGEAFQADVRFSCGDGGCSRDDDCIDEDKCTEDLCDQVTNTCSNDPISGCCDSDAQCGKCEGCDLATNTCFKVGPPCCASDAQCPGKCDVCDLLTNTCVKGVPDCCTSDAQCGKCETCDLVTNTCNEGVRGCGPLVVDTDLTLLSPDLDLRQDTQGPVTTKLDFCPFFRR